MYHSPLTTLFSLPLSSLLFRRGFGHAEKLSAAGAGTTAQLALRPRTGSGSLFATFLDGFFGTSVEVFATQPDLALFRLNAQDLDLDLVADLDHLFRALDLVVGQLRDMEQTFEPLLQFHK